MPAPPVTTILHIAYEGPLLMTRGAILEERGYRVISVMGNKNAFLMSPSVINDIHVVMIGHCAPREVRREATVYFKQKYPQLCVLALNSNVYDGEVEEADFNSPAESPEQWLKAVATAAASICE